MPAIGLQSPTVSHSRRLSFQTDLTVHQIVDNVEFGRGTNTRRGTAAEAAAYHALVALRGY
jgi:dsRNA-specific ribonuclease